MEASKLGYSGCFVYVSALFLF